MKINFLRHIDKFALVCILSGIVLNIFLWSLVLFVFPQHEAAILHYSVDVGIDFIGEGHQIRVLPTVGLCILAGNLFLGLALFKVDKVSSWLFWSMIPVAQIVLIGAYYLIWRANG